MADAGTVLIAVNDGVLADSLRFSLELEGYIARTCQAPFPAVKAEGSRVCLLLDQDVFAALMGKGDGPALKRLGLPTVLMVNQQTDRLVKRAQEIGVTLIVEKPLLGGVLIEGIRSVLDGPAQSVDRPSSFKTI